LESTLSLTLNDLNGQVGLFLGYGSDATVWSTQQADVIDGCVRSGLRQFYFPPPLDGQESSYDWSFMKPVVALTLLQGKSTLELPDDFGGIEGEITMPSTTSRWYALQVTGEGRVRQKYAEMPTTTGQPLMAAVRPVKGTTARRGQESQLYVWPIADHDYTLQFAYYVNPDHLSKFFPYHMGGMAHAETILESCLAIAEQRLDDAATTHSLKFKERLAASVNMDRRRKPQNLGYNRDLSDDMDRGRVREWDWSNPVRINGVVY
jgi:hypothetical protein